MLDWGFSLRLLVSETLSVWVLFFLFDFSMAETKLIPGFRFHPTDVELVMYFLKRKIIGRKFPFDVIAELDIYKYAPWDLPGMNWTLKPWLRVVVHLRFLR